MADVIYSTINSYISVVLFLKLLQISKKCHFDDNVVRIWHMQIAFILFQAMPSYIIVVFWVTRQVLRSGCLKAHLNWQALHSVEQIIFTKLYENPIKAEIATISNAKSFLHNQKQTVEKPVCWRWAFHNVEWSHGDSSGSPVSELSSWKFGTSWWILLRTEGKNTIQTIHT